MVTIKIGLFNMPIIIFENDMICHHERNTYAITKYVVQDIDV